MFRMNESGVSVALIGVNQLQLSIYLFIYPDAAADQICIFIYATGGDINDRHEVTSRCEHLRLFRKKIVRKYMLPFWNYPSRN